MAAAPSGDLYVGGQFTSPGSRIARWDGAAWHQLGTGVVSNTGSSPPEVLAITVLRNGDVVIGGRCDNVGGVSARPAAKWNGSEWVALGYSPHYAHLDDFCELPGGELLATITEFGISVHRVARWDGTAWQPFGSGFGANGADLELLPNQWGGQELYVAGRFSTAGGRVARSLSRWGCDVGGCYANCDGSTSSPVLNVADFTCFLQRYAAADPVANCDQSTVQPTLNVADFTCFLQRFAAGCP